MEYEIKVKCNNCNKESKIKIKRGESVEDNEKIFSDELVNFFCINCGCESLEQIKETYF